MGRGAEQLGTHFVDLFECGDVLHNRYPADVCYLADGRVKRSIVRSRDLQSRRKLDRLTHQCVAEWVAKEDVIRGAPHRLLGIDAKDSPRSLVNQDYAARRRGEHHRIRRLD